MEILGIRFPGDRLELLLSGDAISQVSVTKLPNPNELGVAVELKNGAFSATGGRLNFERFATIFPGIGVKV